jgi:hypothetical protein
MPHYRFYRITPDGHIDGVPIVVECADDQEALGKASQMTKGRIVEVWQGERLVLQLPNDRRR